MAILSLADADRAAAEHKLWAARGRAIQGYAGVEQALCAILSLCTGTSYSVAATIFFKITAARSRNEIIQKLIKKKFGSTYNLFWNSVFKRLRNHLDEQRNKIVHWSALATVGGNAEGGMVVDLCLKPASYWDDPLGDFPRLTAEDMIAFEDECDFYARLIGQFGNIMSGILDASEDFDKAPWLSIYQLALEYPNLSTHPHSQMLSTLQNQHPASDTSGQPPPSQA